MSVRADGSLPGAEIPQGYRLLGDSDVSPTPRELSDAITSAGPSSTLLVTAGGLLYSGKSLIHEPSSSTQTRRLLQVLDCNTELGKTYQRPTCLAPHDVTCAQADYDEQGDNTSYYGCIPGSRTEVADTTLPPFLAVGRLVGRRDGASV